FSHPIAECQPFHPFKHLHSRWRFERHDRVCEKPHDESFSFAPFACRNRAIPPFSNVGTPFD
ncbi:hypothetical protein, partial [Pinirhizobacter sp.]|uniref:hypothetical protein n=1 Tax=Pinirhizobacter sp. TaxID=2950432 RepID=UPI002F42E6EE